MGGFFFFAVSIFVESDIVMRSFCLLASMELILIPNCSLLYLHSNDMNSLKSLFLKNGEVIVQKPANCLLSVKVAAN